MKRNLRVATLALLITSVSACSSGRERLEIQHPPAEDLRTVPFEIDPAKRQPGCMGEPPVEEMLRLDASGLAFDAAVRVAGQTCRDAVARLCKWHVDNGMKLPEGMVCTPPVEQEL